MGLKEFTQNKCLDSSAIAEAQSRVLSLGPLLNSAKALSQDVLTGTNAQKIRDACKKVFSQNEPGSSTELLNKDNCSGFVRCVCAEFGIYFNKATDNADGIVRKISDSKNGWVFLSNDRGVAQERANEGFLVIGGLRSDKHTPAKNYGHVVVVISGNLSDGKWPMAAWGSIAQTRANYDGKSIEWNSGGCWSRSDAENVVYAFRSIDDVQMFKM